MPEPAVAAGAPRVRRQPQREGRGGEGLGSGGGLQGGGQEVAGGGLMSTAVEAGGDVAGDAKQPGDKRQPALLVARQGVERLEEDLLAEVGRVVVALRAGADVGVDPIDM